MFSKDNCYYGTQIHDLLMNSNINLIDDDRIEQTSFFSEDKFQMKLFY